MIQRSDTSEGRLRHLRALTVTALVGLFAFRLFFGLASDFLFEDETQIYLMGLRYYATGDWPYFGPDIVWTRSVIPGALQALLVGLPLKAVPIPEAPYVFLNLLSMTGLAIFAWYITARLPQLPKWLVWGWLMTMPWTLQWSTHIENPSYLLTPVLLFFLAFFEVLPAFRLGKLSEPVAFLIMGAAIAWAFQIHMSWPLLLPYAGLAWLTAGRRGIRPLAINALGFVGGLLLTGSLVIPTLVVYGLEGGSGGTLRNIHVHAVNPWVLVTTLARFFSFVSLEIWRFIATDDGRRQMFFLNNLWIAPFGVVIWAAGIWQPVWMLREWFRARSPFPEWQPLKWLVAGSIVLVYVSYWFVLEPPQAHSFYVLSPIAMLFAAYCWTFVDSPRWRRVAATLLGANIVFHLGQALIHAPEESLYRNREVVVAAIQQKEPEVLAHRRAFAMRGGPASLDDPTRPHDRLNVHFSDEQVRLGPRRVALWTLTVRNTNPRVAFRDIRYLTSYRDGSGKVLDDKTEIIKGIFQPGEVRTVEINDGLVSAPFTSATIEVLTAEALLPIVR